MSRRRDVEDDGVDGSDGVLVTEGLSLRLFGVVGGGLELLAVVVAAVAGALAVVLASFAAFAAARLSTVCPARLGLGPVLSTGLPM